MTGVRPVRLLRSANRAAVEQSAQSDGRARDVVFAYCISCGVVTWVFWSRPHRIRSRRQALRRGLPYTLTSLVLGWWGLPWGAVLTPRAVWTNCTGGVQAPRTDSCLDEGPAPCADDGSPGSL